MTLLPLIPLLAAAATYGLGVARLARRGDGWPAARTAAAIGGLTVLAAAVLPPLADPESFALHAVQHLLLAMAAPLLLALSAPTTLALRTLPRRSRAVLLALVRGRAARFLLLPPVVLMLDLGGMAAYYLTGSFEQAERFPPAHLAVHLHMLLAGCLLAWLLVGRDPVANRPSVRVRLVVLLVAAGSHDVLAKSLVALGLPASVPGPDLRVGAEILFTGGGVLEALTAVALLAEWYAREGRRLDHERRRSGVPRSP